MTRVRVTAPRSVTAGSDAPPARVGRTIAREAAEESDAGQVFVRSLIRSQLRLGVVVAAGFLLILLAFPLMLGLVPGLAELDGSRASLRLGAAGRRDLPGDRPQRLAVRPDGGPERGPLPGPGRGQVRRR